MPKAFSDPERLVDDLLREVGPRLVVALPLGLGKANHLINALFRRAVNDRSIRLTSPQRLAAPVGCADRGGCPRRP